MIILYSPHGGHYYSNFYFHIGYPLDKNNYEGRGLTFAVLIASNTFTIFELVFRAFFFLHSIRTPSPHFLCSLLDVFCSFKCCT